ncbi:MAG: formate hydrogenlyase transcriptional activator [Bacteroidia bacterium]
MALCQNIGTFKPMTEGEKEKTKGLTSVRAELNQLQKHHELILQSAGVGIYGLDENGHTTFANPEAVRMVGYSLEEMIGKSQHELIHHSRQDGQPFPIKECCVYAAIKDGKVHHVEDEFFWRKDGSCFPVEYSSTPIRDESGELKGAVVSFQDITRRRGAEEGLVFAIEELKELKDRLELENKYLQQEIKHDHNFEEIISQSKKFRKILGQLKQVATTNATVLILGESGTGKELVARALHNVSNRKERPLVKLNCAALPAALIESELFGHEKGAFTGALAKRIGRFELADGGTIFLDEIGEMPMELQPKLLRVIQEGEFERVGDAKTKKVDVRIIAATNRNLEEEIEKGNFREDLYYRLNVFPLMIPPLRERIEDIPLLAGHFLRKYAAAFGKAIDSISKPSLDALSTYSWPGNVRELENVIERAVITCTRTKIDLRDSIPLIKASKKEGLITLEESERRLIKKTLEKTNWRVSGDKGAAKRLGVKRTTLEARMKKLNIEKPI